MKVLSKCICLCHCLCLCICLCHCLFVGQVISLHHSDQMSERSQSRIVLLRCSLSVFVFVFVSIFVPPPQSPPPLSIPSWYEPFGPDLELLHERGSAVGRKSDLICIQQWPTYCLPRISGTEDSEQLCWTHQLCFRLFSDLNLLKIGQN